MKRRDRTEYMRAYREAHREQAKEYARALRAGEPDRAKATQMASYLRNRRSRIVSMKRYAAAHSVELNEYRKRWLASDPDRELLYAAKKLIRAATGMRIAAIPRELAEAKAAQLSVIRAVRSAAQEIEAGTDETPEAAQPAGQEPDPKDAPNPSPSSPQVYP